MIRLPGAKRAFRRAVVFSFIFHALLFTLIALSPSLPKPAKQGMIHYVTFGTLPGGGGGGQGGNEGGGGGPKPAPPAANKETLKDLTLASKVTPEVKSSMTYPTDKVKKDKKATQEKKATITKSRPGTEDAASNSGQTARPGTGSGTGLRIGLGDGSGGGPGSGFGDQIGLSNFPYQYYLQIISDRVSAGWFTSFVDPGVSGTFYTTVYFKILRSGEIADLKIAESSGVPSLDLSAQRAIQRASPFPPLPADYEGDYLGIHLIFEHSK